jgi:hypothetical protein
LYTVALVDPDTAIFFPLAEFYIPHAQGRNTGRHILGAYNRAAKPYSPDLFSEEAVTIFTGKNTFGRDERKSFGRGTTAHKIR